MSLGRKGAVCDPTCAGQGWDWFLVGNEGK